MLPCPALLAFRSLELVSCSVLVPASAGSLEGGFKPDGLTFSILDGGRSMLPDEGTMRSTRRTVQCQMKIRGNMVVEGAGCGGRYADGVECLQLHAIKTADRFGVAVTMSGGPSRS